MIDGTMAKEWNSEQCVIENIAYVKNTKWKCEEFWMHIAFMREQSGRFREISERLWWNKRI